MLLTVTHHLTVNMDRCDAILSEEATTEDLVNWPGPDVVCLYLPAPLGRYVIASGDWEYCEEIVENIAASWSSGRGRAYARHAVPAGEETPPADEGAGAARRPHGATAHPAHPAHPVAGGGVPTKPPEPGKDQPHPAHQPAQPAQPAQPKQGAGRR
jgi:hypothetical protein